MSTVTLYIDYLSQPSRAVLSFCLINNIPISVVETKIIEGGTDTAAFGQVSPAHTVPAIVHNGLCLYESHAILIYLAQVFSVPDHWYPSDPAIEAKVNVYLHWHHLNLRFGCAHYFYRKFVRPLFSNRPFSEAFEREMLYVQEKSLQYVENSLKNAPFVAETSEVTIADLSCFCEIIHLDLISFDFSKYPCIQDWKKRMLALQGLRKAHEHFFKYLQSYKL
jgi:glutathione S-transferase